MKVSNRVTTAALSLLAGLCLVSFGAAGQVYKSTDESGSPNYSDVPKPESQELKLPPVNVLPATKPINFDIDDNRSQQKDFKYRSLEITSPKNEETIYINTVNMHIDVRLVPPVRHDLGHRLVIMMDGEIVAVNEPSYLVDDADRGMHIISAQVLNEKDAVLINSEPVTVYIRQPSVLTPP